MRVCNTLNQLALQRYLRGPTDFRPIIFIYSLIRLKLCIYMQKQILKGFCS